MTERLSLARVLTLTAVLVVAGAGLAHAQGQGQVYVLESTADTVRPGVAYGLAERITVPAGSSIRAVMPSGKTQTIKGPFSGLAGDLAKGHTANEGVIAWIKNLLQTGGANERTAGATRSARPQQQAAARFSWTAIPSAVDSTMCVEKGAKLQLQRASSQQAERFVVLDQATAERGETEFTAGSNTAPWPASLRPRADGEYALLGPDNRPRRQVKLRVLDALPGEDDVLVELATHECKHQFDAWVREKVSAGKKAS
jgi:hypothetical protein